MCIKKSNTGRKSSQAQYIIACRNSGQRSISEITAKAFLFFSSRLLLIRLSVGCVSARQTKTHRLRFPKTLPMRSTTQLDSPPDIAEPGNRALRGMICFADVKICHSPVTSETGERMMTLIPQLQYSINFKKCKGLQLHAKQKVL